MQETKTINEIKRIVGLVSYPGYKFDVHLDGLHGLFLQASFQEKDVLTNQIETQKTRKWKLSIFMTKSEIVLTVFKCVLTSVEHETRERFEYKGERIFSPHFDVDALFEICKANKFDERENWYAQETCNLCGKPSESDHAECHAEEEYFASKGNI